MAADRARSSSQIDRSTGARVRGEGRGREGGEGKKRILRAVQRTFLKTSNNFCLDPLGGCSSTDEKDKVCRVGTETRELIRDVASVVMIMMCMYVMYVCISY